MYRQQLEQICKEMHAGESGVLCIVIEQEGSTPRHGGASMWVRPDGSIDGTVGGGPMEHECVRHALAMMEEGETLSIKEWNLSTALTGTCPEGAACGGTARVYFERLVPEEEVVIFGAGHVGKALARLAPLAGFQVTVWDEREEFANAENIPWGRTICCSLGTMFENGVLMHPNAYAVIVTRGHSLDSEVMTALEGRPAAYIGVIGSRSKIKFVEEKLLGQGVSQAHLDRIHRPIGLPIGAETPEEIAVAILAEMIAVRRGANVQKLRLA